MTARSSLCYVCAMPNCNKLKIIIPLIFCFYVTFLISGCSSLHQSKTLYSPYTSQIETVLETAGKNHTQIEYFLNAFDNDPEKRQAAEFIAANLPPCDSTTLSSDLLIENLEYSFLAKDSTAWGRDVSWSDFQNYVLPHRVSQEQAVKWRKLFYQELLPIVSECNTMEEAVLAVNRWCFSKTGFQSTQRWDQNPLMTINRGWGRCEEAVIFTVSALRSVGIPARQAMVPAWQHSNDNHTWTEVLINGKWHYLESANPDYGLDHAWFTGSARKAPLVISYAYGKVLNPKFPIMSRRIGCTLLNTTAMYAPASRAEIAVTDSNGTNISGVKVFISVFNYASFRPVAVKKTDSEGKASILLGPGSVLISVAHGNASAYSASTWIPGEQASRNNITMKLTQKNTPSGNVTFRFKYDDKLAQTAPSKNSEGAQKDEFDNIKKVRLERLNGMKKGAEEFDPALAAAIAKAGLNTPEILNGLNRRPQSSKDIMAESIKHMDIADLVKIKADELISNTDLALKARNEIAEAGLEYDDEIFTQYVLNPRIMYEQLEAWRGPLYEYFKRTHMNKIDQKLELINKFTQNIHTVPRGPLGSAITPLGVLNSQKASSNDETGIFATAALRSMGIPAKYLDEQGWVEFYEGQEWKPFYPSHPDLIRNKNATDSSTAYYSEWQTFGFNFSKLTEGSKPAQYFKDFTVSKLINNVSFQLIEKTIIGGSDNKNIWEIKVPKGEYYLITGKRNNNGEPFISLIPLTKTP